MYELTQKDISYLSNMLEASNKIYAYSSRFSNGEAL